MKKILQNSKMASKLIMGFLVVTLVASISGVTGLAMTKRVDTQYSRVLVENGFTQGDIGQFSALVYHASALVRDMILVEDPQELKALQTELEEVQQKLNDELEAVKVNCTTPKEKEYLKKIEELIPKYREKRDKVIELGIAMKNDEAFRLHQDEARPIMDEITKQVDALIDLNVDLGNQASEEMTASSNRSVLIITTLIVVGLLASVFFAYTFARSIANRIKTVEEAAGKMSEGDLDIQLELDQNDEIGSMKKSFGEAVRMLNAYIHDIDRVLESMSKGNFDVAPGVEYKGNFKRMEASIEKIIGSMTDTLGGIQEASTQVSAGAEQVSSSAQALSQGATEQASSIEELAATINEISNHIQETAEQAKAAQDENEMTNHELRSCSSQMEEMVHAMDAISEKSQEISKIIKTIEDIAFQTNILALNAAVEAARAGEAGKGFAVVADEVRNLAAKSAEAAKNTTTLIEETVQAVESGSHLSAETEMSLAKVVESEEKSIEAIAYISKMATEQAGSVAQVTVGIDQISSVVQTNSATAEESAAASEELSGQSTILLDLVRHFRFKSQGVGYGASGGAGRRAES